MIVGNLNTFAFDFFVSKIIPTDEHLWVYGRFTLYIHDKKIGDPNDETVLDACYSWLKDFETTRMDVQSDQYISMSAHDAIDFYNKFVVGNPAVRLSNSEIERGIHFNQLVNISYIGMSSFDNVTLLMINHSTDQKRFVVQQFNEVPEEFIVKTCDIIFAIRQFIIAYEKQVSVLLKKIQE